ncbi:MAG: ATP-binding protein [Geminicoccaceae bacterium]
MAVRAIQATARARRYALLEAAAEQAGMLHLVVAHHAADQRETVAMRAAAGSGPRGLAGMAPIRELRAVRLLRPLLPVEPARLRALLRARSVEWLEDPSNRDPRFWRARARAAGGLPAVATDAGGRAAEERRLARFLARHARVHPAGLVELPAGALAALVPGERRQLLGRLIAAVGGRSFAPRGRSLARLDAWLCDPSSPRCSLGGTLVERRRGGLRILREARGLPGEAALACGRTLWDGRFRIDWHGAEGREGEAPGLRAAGQAMPGSRGLRAWLVAAGAPEAATLPALALATLPLVSRDARILALGPWVASSARGVLGLVFRPTHTMTAVGSAPSVCCADE